MSTIPALTPPTMGPTSMGVRPVTPGSSSSSNTLPSNQTSSVGRNITSTSTSALQTALTNAGYDTKGVDNQYGPNTTSAVRAYQQANGLATDGIFGPQTLAKLFPSSSSQTGGSTGNSSSSTDPAPTPPPIEAPKYSASDTGLYGKLVTGLANQQPSAMATTAGNTLNQFSQQESPQVAKARQDLRDFQNQLANSTANIQGSGTWSSRAGGEEAILAQKSGGYLSNLQGAVSNALASQGQQIGAASSAGGIGNSQQELIQQALGSAAGYAAPQFPSYTSAQFNPTSNTYGTVGGGQYGSGPGAASNVTSVGQAQSGINSIVLDSPAIDNQFSALVNYANTAGLTGNSPILAGFQNKFGSNFQTNPAVIGFNAALSSLNQKLQAQGEQQIDPSTATMTTIQQAQQTVKADLARKKDSYQSFLNQFNSGSSGGSNSYSYGGQTYHLPY